MAVHRSLLEQLKTNMLVGTAAFLCAIAFIAPLYCAELIFLGLALLWYVILHNPHALKTAQALIWGSVFSGIYWQGIVQFLYNHAEAFQLWAILFLLGYALFSVMVWFFCASCMQMLVHCKGPLVSIMVWGITTWIYFFWVDTRFFGIFNYSAGNPLAFALLPLLVRPTFFWFVAHCSREILLMIWILTALVIAYGMRRHPVLTWGGIFILIVGNILYCFHFYSDVQHSDVITKKIGCIVPRATATDPWQTAERLAQLFENFSYLYPEKELILLPESAYPFPLNKCTSLATMWQQPRPTSCIIGSHYQDTKDRLYNSAYLINLHNNSRIMHHYDKKTPLFFTETIPFPWNKLSISSSLFLDNHLPFHPGKIRSPFLLLDKYHVIPYICADIFLKRTITKKDDIILCMVNDSWFENSYICHLMLLHALYIAIQSECPLLYIGYIYQFLVTPQGIKIPLTVLYEE